MLLEQVGMGVSAMQRNVLLALLDALWPPLLEEAAAAKGAGAPPALVIYLETPGSAAPGAADDVSMG